MVASDSELHYIVVADTIRFLLLMIYMRLQVEIAHMLSIR